MTRRFFSGVCCMVVALAALVLIACGGSGDDATLAIPAAGLTAVKQSITVNGVSREYFVYVQHGGVAR